MLFGAERAENANPSLSVSLDDVKQKRQVDKQSQV